MFPGLFILACRVIFFVIAITLFPELLTRLSCDFLHDCNHTVSGAFKTACLVIFFVIAVMLFPGRRVVLRRFLLATEIETVLLSWTSDPLDVPNFRSIWGRRLNQRKGFCFDLICLLSVFLLHQIGLPFELNSVITDLKSRIEG